jgi:hypothetical protein
MALGPEAKVKVQVDKWIKEKMPNAYKYKPPGGMYGSIGVGDYIVVYLGVPIMIEVKKDRSNKPTKMQELALANFKLAGGVSCVLFGFEEAKLDFIRQLCERKNVTV